MVRFSASLSCVCGLVNKSLHSVSRLASKSENVCVLVGGSNVKMEWRNQKETLDITLLTSITRSQCSFVVYKRCCV